MCQEFRNAGTLHPFSTSSAPNTRVVSIHIRVIDEISFGKFFLKKVNIKQKKKTSLAKEIDTIRAGIYIHVLFQNQCSLRIAHCLHFNFIQEKG